jgi:hypothetical protein
VTALKLTLAFHLVLATALAACGGPVLKYDRAPSPKWIHQAPTGIGPGALTAVGAAPATTDVNRDRDLATRNAKSQVAQLFESKINSRTSDWSLAMTGGAADVDLSGVQQSIRVSSNVTVEDVSVQSEYRDEATRSHYVRIVVDRVAWVERIRGRIGDGLDKFEASIASARDAAGAHRPLSALKHLLAASQHGRQLEPDITVVDLIDRGSSARAKLDALRENMDKLSRALRSDYKFVLSIESPDSRAAGQLSANLEQFLGSWGFSPGDKGEGRTIRLDVTIGQRALPSEQVAGRTECVHAGTGSLHVLDADGSEVAELTVQFSSNRYRERDTDRKRAAAKALSLAADTLASKFRSAFRNAYADYGS